MATAKVQVRHLDLHGLRMLLIDVGDLIPFQPLNELVYFRYVVPFMLTLHQRANGGSFRGKNKYLIGILGLQEKAVPVLICHCIAMRTRERPCPKSRFNVLRTHRQSAPYLAEKAFTAMSRNRYVKRCKSHRRRITPA